MPDHDSPTFYNSITELQKPLIKQALVARSTKPAAFVLDLMCVTMIDIANEFGIPSYMYFTAGACFLNLMLHFQELVHDKGVDLTTELCNPDTELVLPFFRNRVPSKVIPLLFADKEGGWSMLIHDISRRFREVKGIIVNTFVELESYAIQTLHDHDKIPNVYPVGSVVALDVHNRYGGGGPQLEDRDDSIMRWLDEQPLSSVVFLCFGSMGSFDEEQMKEIANGLDRCGHRFLWSLRRPSSRGKVVLPSENVIFEEALPEGFLDRTTHRGKIIGWASQVQILAHQAIGGFVSHCGWNSILESLWFGVPIATWPIYSEQQLNAFELIKELELAVDIRMDYRRDLRMNNGNFVVMAEEVETGVNTLMSMGDQMRQRIREMSDTSRKVLQNGGSSHNCLTRFIREVLEGDVIT
ncbi:hypothetical protein BVRB_6g141320 [Beta vulgaris subsp. vulgaris]|nr:hypothetical protein BVRB_6g141320 [Beta vulgaris subsp. vulgaris]